MTAKTLRTLCTMILMVLSIWLLLTLQSGCKHDTASPLPMPVVVDSCATENSWSETIAPIINTYCALSGCHVPAGFKDFTTYAAIQQEIQDYGSENFIGRISSGGGMPPDFTTGPQQLSPCEYTRLVSWIRSGYPE